MSLSNYHQKYIELSDHELSNRANEKEQELELIFQNVHLDSTNEKIRIAILGCGDERFINHHLTIFSKYFSSPVELTTFDISIDHLVGKPNVIQHDCTKPIPNGPYEITYAHVLLKFIQTEKQWDLLLNSYEVLVSGGIAIHVMDKEDYETETTKLSNGLYTVPLSKWENQLIEFKIKYKIIPVKYGKALILIK